MSDPLVSIVTICFNHAAYIREAIESVLNQDYDRIEYVVVDAGSTDGSRDIIETYRPRLSKVIFEPDDGPADGLNKGFEQTSGEILGYLNADDLYLPGSIRSVVRAFEARPHVAAIYGNGYLVDEKGHPTRHCRSTCFTPRRGAYGLAIVMQQATFFRRDAWKEIQGFNVENKISWDFELLVDLALAKKQLVRIDEDWGLFRVHDESITSRILKNGSDPASLQTKELVRSNTERIFAKIMKREPRPSDKLVRAVGRLYKWTLDPRGFFDRLRGVALPNRSQARLKRALSSRTSNSDT